MNGKKGQIIFYSLMVGVVVFIVALALASPITDSIGSVMNETSGDLVGLNCTSTDSNFIKATCVVTDITPFYFIGFLLFLAGAIVTAKWMVG